ncbi:transporter substrate-binding domain-containing protein [Gilvimarinus sp. SDUM040013]|uniref:Transporter substrate-binding domain-containing protein n=1 Tax=Gilvimarinus gilvus TaxID=3058038 RepID=A0ABU4S1Y0_9GAMM|nr:transporter substrate-binding domain-containing protein [Gilvimarinus sp. SDUM040013]MDO3384425.1 transporter substrate-binding domain-containing protein [Gilvimarinus sp. SDUM040013]MDX6851030.1 transporter substrate-binding domain-containing protein [Gilvimarinus sp. SDUM040013]
MSKLTPNVAFLLSSVSDDVYKAYEEKGFSVRESVSVKVLFLVLASLTPFWHAHAGALKFISIDVEPWASNVNGEMKGAFIEMVRGITERTELDIAITLTPFARVDRELETGGHDCTILIPRSEEIVKPGELVAFHEIGLLGRPGVVLDHYSDLSDLTVSVLRGSSITEQFDSDDTLDKVYDTDYLIALRKLERGRVDAIAGAIPTIRYLADNNGLSAAIGEELVLGDVPLVFQCSRQSKNLHAMKKINHAIRQMKEDGTIERIRQQYYF